MPSVHEMFHRLESTPIEPASVSSASEGAPATSDSMPRVAVYLGEAVASRRREDLALLSEEERSRAQRFARPQDAAHYIGAHANVRRSVARYLTVDPREVSIGRQPCARCGSTEHGPPTVVRPSGVGHISLSRAGRRHAIAIGDAPLGVDIERRRGDTDRLATAVLTSMELRLRRSVQHDRRDELFLRWWVRKEAVAKALALGLAADVASIDVSGGRVPAGAWELQVVPVRAGELDWIVVDVQAPSDVFAALAIRCPANRPPDVNVHRLP